MSDCTRHFVWLTCAVVAIRSGEWGRELWSELAITRLRCSVD